MLAPLPYVEWKATKTTLHLMCQIVGKIRLHHVPHKSQWWNVTLHPTARGLSTLRMRAGETFFEIEFDFVEHRTIVRTSASHAPATIELRDGLSVAEFHRELFTILRGFGLDISIVDKPYGMGIETPFSLDTEHASYDKTMVTRWWRVVLWSADVFDRYASDFNGKESPAHLFWHAFDLALARFSGRPANAPANPDPVQQEAYSHEVIAVGFWPGDEKTPYPAYYTYTAPEPETLATTPLAPEGASWVPSGSGHLGVLAYDVVRESADPAETLLAFVNSGFDAGARAAAWDTSTLRSAFGQ
jgi:hypothetical protein